MLVMDQLSIHKSIETKALLDELGFYYSYTPVYDPKFNGIEEVFSMAKRLIKKKRLELIIKN